MRQFFAQHKLRIILIGIILMVFTVVGFNLFYGELRKRSKAAPTGTPILSLDPVSSPPMNADRGMKVTINLDPNGATQELYSFDLQVKFNPDKFEFYNGTLEDSMMLSSDVLKIKTVLEGSDTIHIIGSKTGTPFTTSNKLIASVFFKMKQGKDFPVEFTWGETILQTSNFVKVPLSLSSNSTSSSSSSQNAEEVKLTFSSPLIQYHVGDTVKLDLIIASGSKQYGSVGVWFVFDPSILEYKSAVVDTTIFDNTKDVITPFARGNYVRMSGMRNSPISGIVKFATVTFTAKSKGTVNFAYTKENSFVNAYGSYSPNILTTVEPYSVSVGTISSSSSSSTPEGGIPDGVEEESRGDLLHVNSNASYPSPFRYEQTMELESTKYVLSGLARVYTQRGRGVVLVLSCGEASCNNGRKKDDVVVRLPFKISSTFRRQEVNFEITNGPKKYTLRIYAEDGSEVDFDYISIKNIWDGELVENWHFEKKTSVSFPRRYPDGWDADVNGIVYGGLYNQKDPGNVGMLYINSSVRQ